MRSRELTDVLRPLRMLISLATLAGLLWFTFTVPLGGQTLARHIDRISETPEAQQLLEGMRSTIGDSLGEVRDRMLGEYVEAPTAIGGEVVPASTLPPEPASGSEPPLPGRRLRPNVLERAVEVPVEAVREPEPEPEPIVEAREVPIYAREAPIYAVEADEVVEQAEAEALEPSEPALPWMSLARAPIQASDPSPASAPRPRSMLAPLLEYAATLPERPAPAPLPEPSLLPELPGAY